MTRQAIYDRLRAIGVSVESADAVSEALEPLPDEHVRAVFLCLVGYNNCQVARILNRSEFWVRSIIKNIENAIVAGYV
jgi:DNA-directed RNA polymerase specialized sigma24 family protein